MSDGLKSAAPHLDWEKIEKALIPRKPGPPLTFADIYGTKDVHVRTCQEGGEQHIWRVYFIKNGRVTWNCKCGARSSKQVRIYGILPAQFLFSKGKTWSTLAVPLATPS